MSGELMSMVSFFSPDGRDGPFLRQLWRLLGCRLGEGLRRLLSPGLLLGGRDLDRLLDVGLAVEQAGAGGTDSGAVPGCTGVPGSPVCQTGTDAPLWSPLGCFCKHGLPDGSMMSQRWTSWHLLLLQPRASFQGLQSFSPLLSAQRVFDTALDRAGPSCRQFALGPLLPPSCFDYVLAQSSSIRAFPYQILLEI